MGQLLVMLIIPPIIGIVTYAVLRLIWKKDEAVDREGAKQHEFDAGLGTASPSKHSQNGDD